jgi:hypothetical protein
VTLSKWRRWLVFTAASAAAAFIYAACAEGPLLLGETEIATVSDAGDAGLDASSSLDGALNCASHPSACGYPDETNTGPLGASLTKYNGPDPMVITTDGAVVCNLDIFGSIEVQANDVTLCNLRVTNDGNGRAVLIDKGYQNLVIMDSTLAGTGLGDAGIAEALLGTAQNSVTVQRCDIHHCAQCLSISHLTVEDSYIHDNSIPVYPIYDNCGEAPGVFRHNTIFDTYSNSVAVSIAGDPVLGTECHDVTVDNNLLAGGNPITYGGMSAVTDHGTTNMVYTNNRFSKILWPDGGSYVAALAFDPNGVGNVWSGNFWDDTGAPVLP